jgi:3-hydroxy-3-methylglutaryl CoA synthase
LVGIKEFGAYLPRRRLQRSVMAEANSWFDKSLKSLSKGERTMCNWDEDSITMGVEAAQDLENLPNKTRAIILASTTLPFAVRQNAGIVAEALNFSEDIRTMDVAGSLRAATTSLVTALDIASAQNGDVLLIASDNRKARAGSQMEMISGDGAAAFVISQDNPGLKFLGSTSINDDFIDHFRASGDDYDYTWEDRWIRQEGWLKTVPKAINMALMKVGVDGSQIDYLIVPCQYGRVAESIAKMCNISPDSVVNTMLGSIGICGTAHPLLMLTSILSKATPGQKILITGFGQGCDALIFEVTTNITNSKPNRGIEGWLNRKVEEKNYEKFLTFNGVINREFGKRAELDRPPALTAQYRNKEGVTGFKGGRCKKCGTIQYPKSIYCVNPNCGAKDTQESYSMSTTPARVKTYTADHLVFSMEPPAYFGLIEFEGGGRMMVEFTDLDPETFDVGVKTMMHFRIKHLDENRGMRQYFWKASPE